MFNSCFEHAQDDGTVGACAHVCVYAIHLCVFLFVCVFVIFSDDRHLFLLLKMLL